MKYSDLMADQLRGMGYTHCFFLAGGNIMHLVESCRTRSRMVPVIHEVAAVIGAEYFNECAEPGQRAFALVTAGPGLTNAVTGIAGAWLESRELLVLGGQVKAEDLATGGIRQRGIQEIDGVELVSSITKAAVRLATPLPVEALRDLIERGREGRPGPVFIEVCLDVQAASVADQPPAPVSQVAPAPPLPAIWTQALQATQEAQRPLLLLGAGVSRRTARELRPALESLGIPVAVTWNAFDRMPTDSAIYAGRPNTWGMRWSNIVLQQCDMLLAIGTRLGLQQTGFAWQQFAPLARIAQVDIDPAELVKARPMVEWPVLGDAGEALRNALGTLAPRDEWASWRDFVAATRAALPLVEAVNVTGSPHVVPQQFVADLAAVMADDEVLIPSSSGGAFTVAMQVFENKPDQIVISNKALARTEYGQDGPIGASLAHPDRRVVLTEGDGGFAQNVQDLGTVAVNGLRIKMFVMSNGGYASIRMTQRNYFDRSYVGCDAATGLGMPDLERLAAVWNVPFHRVNRGWTEDPQFRELFDAPGPALFEVPVDVEQPYWPKIGSRVTPEGSMVSAALHLMSPDLDPSTSESVMPYLLREGKLT